MTDEEHVTAELLRLAGAPADPPADRAARVREAVHREWRASRRRRVIRRGAAIALSGVAASFLTALLMNRPRPAVAPADRGVAVGQRILGQPLIVHGRGRDGAPRPLSTSDAIYADDVIETDAASRAALLTTGGGSVRIDRASRVRFIAPEVIEVIAGAVYVATSDGSHGFEVRTVLGSLRDVGTRFEVRLTGSSLRLRVRAGAVEIHRGGRVATAAAGTEAMVTSSGIDLRQVPAYGPEWEWAAGMAPSFAIEGRSLGVFLEHLAAEEGWTLQYSDPDVAGAASLVILHGSVDGLDAEDALRAVVATSGFQYRLRSGELLVSRPAR